MAIRHVQFDGNGGPFSGQNDLQLRHQLETEDSPFGLLIWPALYLVDPSILNVDLLPRDAYRLEVWYAHNGWFDAEVKGWELHMIRSKGKHRSGVIDIVGHVRPGPPSLVSEYEISGLSTNLKVLASTVRQNGYLHENTQFNLGYANQSRILLQQLLQNHAHAYASVDMAVRADPINEQVAVELQAVPGIRTEFGEISVSGNEVLPERFIRDAVTFDPGDPYKIDLLNETQRKLFDMGTFAVVSVRPDLSDPTRVEVPVDVTVKETTFRRLRFGLGGNVEGGATEGATDTFWDGLTYSPRISTNFRHTNFLKQLIRLDLNASGGLYYEPVQGDLSRYARTTGPGGQDYIMPVNATGDDVPNDVTKVTGDLSADLFFPRVWGPDVGLEIGASGERNVQANTWLYVRYQTNVDLVWNPTRLFTVRAGPDIEWYGIPTGEPIPPRQKYLLFGEKRQETITDAFTEQTYELHYLITSLKQEIINDTNPKRYTQRGPVTRGRYVAFALKETLPLLDSELFVSIHSDIRFFVPLKFGKRATSYPLLTAWAFRSNYVFAYQKNAVIPYPERTFLGGSNSIRGFRTDQVGPYDNYSDGEFSLPRGGTLSLQTSGELRYPWINGITFATFVDAGMLVLDPAEIGFDDFRMSVGVGARYATLVGPLRFDVSFRPTYDEDCAPAGQTCTEGGTIDRAYDFFSGFKAWDNQGKHPPYAMVFYIAIGEAI